MFKYKQSMTIKMVRKSKVTRDKITISIDKSLRKLIDRKRGLVNRSVFIEEIINEFFRRRR